MDRCANCERVIGNLETPCIYQGKVVCAHCDALLRSAGKSNPVIAGVTVQAPIIIDTSQHRRMSGFGVAALVLGILACVTCWIPFLGLLIIPMAAIGLILGIIGIVAAALTKKTHIGLPITGSVVCILAVAVSIAVSATVAAATIPTRIDEAKWSEARAAAGTIVSAMRAYGAEKGNSGAWDRLAGKSMSDAWVGQSLGITPYDLDGSYFDAPCYTIKDCSWDSANELSCTIAVNATASSKPHAPTLQPTERSLVVVHGQVDYSVSTLTPLTR